MNEITISSPIPLVAPTPLDMLNRAVATGAGLDVIERLMALQERYEAKLARKAFDAAIAQAKQKLRPVVKTTKGHNYLYADFGSIARRVDPIISEAGLSYRFRTAQTDGRITVTCVLSHVDGHSEENTLSGPEDKTGSKNAIQAIGSTLTYLQRYSLIQSLGLAVTADDDGAGAGEADPEPKFITVEQQNELADLLAAHGRSIEDFCVFGRINDLSEIVAGRFEGAVEAIKRDKWKVKVPNAAA